MLGLNPNDPYHYGRIHRAYTRAARLTGATFAGDTRLPYTLSDVNRAYDILQDEVGYRRAVNALTIQPKWQSLCAPPIALESQFACNNTRSDPETYSGLVRTSSLRLLHCLIRNPLTSASVVRHHHLPLSMHLLEPSVLLPRPRRLWCHRPRDSLVASQLHRPLPARKPPRPRPGSLSSVNQATSALAVTKIATLTTIRQILTRLASLLACTLAIRRPAVPLRSSRRAYSIASKPESSSRQRRRESRRRRKSLKRRRRH